MSGFSLLELLVAVLVVAVGALGVAGLQLASSQNNRGALEHSMATILANDVAERMAANPTADYAIGLGTEPPAFVDCLANHCTPSQLARFDLASWKCGFGRWRTDAVCEALPAAIRPTTTLPGGDGAVVGGTTTATVSVVWGARRDTFDLEVHR